MTRVVLHSFLSAVILVVTAQAAAADLRKVEDRSTFLALVSGKSITRPLVELRVTADGQIRGTGAAKTVRGNWSWQDGYFCRDLFWGERALGYNCQEVRANDAGRIRFTSDRGNGDTALFRLK